MKIYSAQQICSGYNKQESNPQEKEAEQNQQKHKQKAPSLLSKLPPLYLARLLWYGTHL